jgi:hypothetical protein
MKRPSEHELWGKLKSASEAAEGNRVYLVEPTAILADLSDLNIMAEDLNVLIPKMVAEIGPAHYRGKSPPEKSYEDAIKGCELYAFRWESKELGCVAYFKFALKDGALWISSLHPDRPKKEGD